MTVDKSKCDRRGFLRLAGGGAMAGAGVSRGVTLEPSQAAPAPPIAAGDLCFTSASELVALIMARKVSAREVMAAHLERIRRVNPKINAIVAKLDDEKCLALADAADQRTARGGSLPLLHGLPIAFKDLQPAVGFPYTRGSTI